jgi:hypothetical protein
MNEHAPEGALWEASPETYAETSGVSVRHQYNLIRGWDRNDRHTDGFLETGVLTEVRKAQRLPRPRPAAYRFNEFALRLRPKLLARLEAGVQQTLEGVLNRQPLPTTAGNRCHDDRQPLPARSATVADDSKATTSKTIQERERDSTTATRALSLNDHGGEIEDEWTWSQRRGH